MNSQSLNGLHNTRIKETQSLPSPAQLKADLPIDEKVWCNVFSARQAVQNIVQGTDQRFLAVIGPCSIHDEDGACEYAVRFVQLANELSDRICMIMRFCPDKPRTRLQWLGFSHDPLMDGRGDIALGWRKTRALMLDVISRGVPIATEFGDDDNYQRYDDLISYAWLGARNVTSQVHRQMISGLSPSVGVKNGTDGNIKDAIDTIHWAQQPNVFAATHDNGTCTQFLTKGNPDVHLVHRGSREGRNYDEASIRVSAELLLAQKLNPRILVDASHDNSGKDHLVQEVVINEVVRQYCADGKYIIGALHESYLVDGKQALTFPMQKDKLRYGVSVTDACDGWERTERIWRSVYDQLGPKFTRRVG